MTLRAHGAALWMALPLVLLWAGPLAAQDAAPTSAEQPEAAKPDAPVDDAAGDGAATQPGAKPPADAASDEKPRAVPEGDELLGIGGARFKIHPFITEQVWWDDNIFLEDENHDTDRYIDQKFGVLADYRSQAFDLDLGYTTSPRHYFHHSESDFTENFADLVANLKPGAWHITGEAHFSQTFNALDTIFASIQEVQTTKGKLEVGAAFDRLSFSQRWEHTYTILGLAANRLFNNTLDSLTTEVAYRFWDKNEAFVEYLYETRDFENTILDDSTRNRYGLGLRGSLSAKMTYELRLAYDDVGFEQSSGTNPFTENCNGLNVRGQIAYQPTPKIDLTLTYERGIQPSTATHFTMADTAILGYTHRWSEQFTTKVDVLSQRVVESNQSVAGADTTRVWNSVSATYALTRWLDAEVGYKYRIQNTNDGTSEYDNNQAWIGATLRF